MRRRFIQINGELVEVSLDFEAPARHGTEAAQAGILWNDRAYQDAGDRRFTSRTQHRLFMKARGLTTVDDYTNQWRADEKHHIEVRAGKDPSRKADIARAIDVVNSRRRK
jgi:hypothetical protein